MTQFWNFWQVLDFCLNHISFLGPRRKSHELVHLSQRGSNTGNSTGCSESNCCFLNILCCSHLLSEIEKRIFQPFPNKNQASDWLTQQVNQLEAWFLAGNGWDLNKHHTKQLFSLNYVVQNIQPFFKKCKKYCWL